MDSKGEGLVGVRGEALVKKRCCHVKALPREHRKMLNDKMMMRTKLQYSFLNKKICESLKVQNIWVCVYEAMLENEVCYVRQLILKASLSKIHSIVYHREY